MLLLDIYLLTRSDDGARKAMRIFGKDLGEPLPEKSYAEDCSFSEIWDKILDPFVLSHGIGWMVNALVSRTFFMVVVLSGVDELCELWWRSSYNNFKECWWDHLILDMMLTNALGAWLGAWIMRRFFNQSRDYIGMFKDNHTRGWLYLGNLVGIKVLNMFVLFGFKSVLWVPPGHWINVYRMLAYCVFLEAGCTQIYNTVKKDKRGWRHNSWVLAFWATMIIDSLLVFRLGYHTPIWYNMNEIGKVLFWVGAAGVAYTFRVFFD